MFIKWLYAFIRDLVSSLLIVLSFFLTCKFLRKKELFSILVYIFDIHDLECSIVLGVFIQADVLQKNKIDNCAQMG